MFLLSFFYNLNHILETFTLILTLYFIIDCFVHINYHAIFLLFLSLSLGIFFFQFFFFWMMMMTQGKRKHISLDTMIFFFHVSSSCMSFPDTLFCVRPDPLRALKSHLCLGLPAWWSLMGSPVWSKRYPQWVHTHSLQGADTGGIKWENSSPMDASTTCGQGSPGEHFLGIVENVLWISSGTFKWETL